MDPGTKYSAVARFDGLSDRWPKEKWYAEVEAIATGASNETEVWVSMWVPKRARHGLLDVASRFQLFDGRHPVADVEVVGELQKPSEWLNSVVEPIAPLLEPLGYQLGETQDEGAWFVDATWETDFLFVQAGYEGRDNVFDVMVARALPHYSPFMQPYWTKVYLWSILQQRGLGHEAVDREWGRSAEGVRRYAEAAVRDLAQIGDILRGEHLEELDRIISSRPRIGVPGLDYPA
jgi:hypothetical protein